jgi:hypothetical protein
MKRSQGKRNQVKRNQVQRNQVQRNPEEPQHHTTVPQGTHKPVGKTQGHVSKP